MIRPDLRSLLLTAALVAGLARPAAAQMGPGGFGAPGGGGMQPPPPGGAGEKEEGPAEEAPEENRPADLEPLGEYAEQTRKKMQIFELDGYLRLRSDYMHNFALGQAYTGVPDGVPGVTYGLPPFPLPLECPAPTPTNQINTQMPTANSPNVRCPHDSIGGANLRFRLEPTLNVTDQVRIHAQIDVLDNTILGSTPDSLAGIPGYNVPPATTTATSTGPVSPTSMPGVAPAGFLYTTQDAPEVGQNGFVSSIRAKRAWAEVDTEFGSLRFGRMPWQWGRGIFYNAGGCADCDVGTTVDRVMALTTLYGHQFAASWDLGAQGPTTQQLTLGRTDPNGYQYDLSQNDDVLQLMASVTRIDDPVVLRERVDRGDIVVNYGLQVVYRNQGNTNVPQNSAVLTPGGNQNGAQPQSPDQLAQESYFGALTLTPDLWLKLYYKALTVEFEGIGIFGRIDRPGALAVDGNDRLSLRQLGWVAAGELKLYRDAFFIGLETGGATGDQAEQPGQYLNYRWRFVQQPAGDHDLNDFHFSPDYHIDEILFRHIIGTVTNAIYIKPQAAYWFDLGRTRSVGVSGAAVYSMAQVPVSTPGNSINYGIETDLGAGYRNTGEGFYAGVTWAILWPLGALDRPAGLWGPYAADASVAQILRVTFGVKF